MPKAYDEYTFKICETIVYNIELKIDPSSQLIVHTTSLEIIDKRDLLAANRAEVNAILKTYFSRDCRYEKDEHGRPYIPDFEGSISISHSKNLCGVYISNCKQVGLDIQVIEERIMGIIPKFLSEEEQVFLNLPDNRVLPEEIATIMWCIKESLYKKHTEQRLNFQQDISVQNLDFSKNRALVNVSVQGQTQQEKLAFLRLTGYVICYTL